MLIEKRSGRRLMNQINVVPYIDVMLVLLVIFMVTAPMMNPSKVDLPSVGKTTEIKSPPLQIIVDKKGEMTFRDQDGKADALDGVAKQGSPSASLHRTSNVRPCRAQCSHASAVQRPFRRFLRCTDPSR